VLAYDLGLRAWDSEGNARPWVGGRCAAHTNELLVPHTSILLQVVVGEATGETPDLADPVL